MAPPERGADPAFRHAEQTVLLSGQSLTVVEAYPQGEDDLGPALEAAMGEQRDAEHTLDVWRTSGSGRLAWESVAACLWVALRSLSDALMAGGHAIPPDLEQAAVMAWDSSSYDCRGQ